MSPWMSKVSSNLEDYEQWVRQNLWDDLDELKDRALGCWCVTTRELEPVECHGQVLMRLVLEKEE